MNKLAIVVLLLLVATVAAQVYPCEQKHDCRDAIFHVSSITVTRVDDNYRYEMSGYVKEPGRKTIVYRTECWEPIKLKHFPCERVEAGYSYRAKVFPDMIDFSTGGALYDVISQREVEK